MSEQNQSDIKIPYPISYNGNILWPILLVFLFFPAAILLLLFNGCVYSNGTCYSLQYRGSTFWLVFWTIVFFPVAIILGILKGFDIIGTKNI